MTPVDFPELTVDADNYEAALRVTTSKLARQLRSLCGSVRTQLSAPVVAELDRVNVTLKRPRAATVRIAVSLVVTIQETSRGLLFVVRAPEVPQFAVALQNRETVAESAKRALTGILAHWDLDAVLSCDDVGAARLETVRCRSRLRGGRDDGDDGFSLEAAADDLTAQAAAGRRRASTAATLSSSGCSPRSVAETRASVVLVGPQDVGKTALVDEVASRLAAGDVPAPLEGRRALADLGERADRRRDATPACGRTGRARLVARGRAEGAIFAMGDPNGIIDAGRWSGSDNNLGRVLQTVRRERRAEPHLRVHRGASPPATRGAELRRRVPADRRPRAARRRRARDPDAAGAAARGEARRRDRAGGERARRSTSTRRFEPYRALPGKAVRLLEESSSRSRPPSDGERASAART